MKLYLELIYSTLYLTKTIYCLTLNINSTNLQNEINIINSKTTKKALTQNVSYKVYL